MRQLKKLIRLRFDFEHFLQLSTKLIRLPLHPVNKRLTFAGIFQRERLLEPFGEAFGIIMDIHGID